MLLLGTVSSEMSNKALHLSCGPFAFSLLTFLFGGYCYCATLGPALPPLQVKPSGKPFVSLGSCPTLHLPKRLVCSTGCAMRCYAGETEGVRGDGAIALNPMWFTEIFAKHSGIIERRGIYIKLKPLVRAFLLIEHVSAILADGRKDDLGNPGLELLGFRAA